MFDLNRLRLLHELRQRGTVRAVAAALHYSPSTVSQQLTVLEHEAGVPLLHPVGRRVGLTPQGKILARHADGVLRQLDAAQAELAQSVDEVMGTLRIAGFQSVLLSTLPLAMTDLEAQHPRLRVELLQAEPEAALPQLLARTLDLAVCEVYPGQSLPQPNDIEYRELCRDRMMIALPRDHQTDRAFDSADAWGLVRHRPWVVEPNGASSRRWILDLCRSAGFEPEIRHQTDDLLVHRALVASGHAVAVLPDLISSGLDDEVTHCDLPGGPHYRRIVVACHRSAAQRPAIRACQDALERHATNAAAPAHEN